MKQIAAAGTGILVLGLLATPAIGADQSWAERIALKGDVRLRHERIDEDGEEERNRMRYRARLGLEAKLNDEVKVVVGLATGGDSPVSTNQTFDDGFSTKDIGLDLAYVDWKINDTLNFFGGKIKNPLFRAGGTGLIWDGDLNPEGFALTYSNDGLFATVGAYSAEERSSADDSLLYTLQAGYKFAAADNVDVTAGVGYFAYTDTVGNAPFYNGRAQGNTVDASGDYLFDYKNTELFAQLDTELSGWPLRIFVHATQNNEVSAEDTAIAFGAKLGSAKSEGDVEFGWSYQEIEADAVVGTFSDSDFGGGGTDSDGHILKAKYAYRNNIFLGGTLFINEIDRVQGTEHDYSRLQLDVEFKFK